MYVDDIGSSKATTTEVKQIISDIDAILKKGHFQIKAWHSNRAEIDQSNGERWADLLGLRWDKQTDKFSLKRNKLDQMDPLTKRRCLGLIGQLWDPIGLVMPVAIKFRIDLQDLWHSGYNWDETLPTAVKSKWMENLQAMNHLLTVEFDRKLKPSHAIGVPQIHGFCDGGEKAYGAVIFLRWELKNGSYKPHHVNSNLSSRVAEIQETVGVEDFRYIRSKFNPADILTRGIEPSQLEDWIKGPSFLQLPEGQWPKFEAKAPIEPTAKAGVLMEVKIEKTKTPMQHEAAIAEFQTKVDLDKSEEDTNPVFHQLLNTCSTFSKIRRTLAYVRRFIQNARKKNVKTGSITVQGLQGSEKQLFKWSQAHLDPSLIDKKLTPKLDENGLLRAHGRLEDVRSLPQELRNPIILLRDHPLVILLLRDLHERRGHCGYKSLINEARGKYCIIGVRGMSKALTTKCITCRKLRKKPLEQLMGQILSLRVAVGTPPFFNTAMDMFGTLHIKLNRKTLKEAQVIIFTCMTTRAVHLELVTDKTSDAFLMAFRRFASLRGHPCICWSDCGTNVVGAQGYLKEIMQSWNVPKIEGVLSEDFSCDFKWKWNTSHASHQNGVVETLIKSVRQSLSATCKNQAFTEEQWRTFLAETTYVINGRPLYPSSDSIWESPPITPNDILIGHHLSIPQPEPEERINPRHLLRSTENRVNEFWRCWMRYFAPNLLPRNKWFRTRENLQVDDLVLEIDPNHKRSLWKMARIIATYPGNDGLVRKTRIKTQDGEYDRPIHNVSFSNKRRIKCEPFLIKDPSREYIDQHYVIDITLFVTSRVIEYRLCLSRCSIRGNF
ncbi:uncharacterized protein [Montipora capricornis]|uniref:uncharacterized protein n=1 Tax=Montipora capricornis TaxID=246305 RepID=UPI0035F210D7